MGLMIDTSVFLWLLGWPEKIPQEVRAQLADADTRVGISIVSLWEILIKHGKGKLDLDTGNQSVLDFLLEQCAQAAVEVLPVMPGSLAALERLPKVHGDPFDRLLICQAIEHGLAMVTSDADIRRYPIRTLW